MKQSAEHTTTHQQNTQQSEEYTIRVGKVERLRAQGIEPWPAVKPVHDHTAYIVGAASDPEDTVYTLAGRLMAIRNHGKSSFARIQDSTGSLQLYFQEELLGDAYQRFLHLIDIGDILWVRGPRFTTKSGEITLRVQEYTLLSKCLHPLPEKFHGIADTEIKYRQRYLDLITSAATRERFYARSHIIAAIRTFLEARSYLEVETPMLQQIAGGAAARPFITRHNTLDQDLYLRIAPELYLKRLVIGGFERVYEINRNFRNEGISTRHNPEFTMLELYTAHHDLTYAMNLVEELVRTAAIAAAHTLRVPFGTHTIDFESPWRRISMKDAICEYGNLEAYDLAPEHITGICARHRVSVEPTASYGHKLVALFEHIVETQLIQPTFIHSFPVEVSPLAKRDSIASDFVPRFELFVAGMELSNAYHELNDPFEQAERFHEQLTLKAGGDEEAHQFDQDYVTALEYGLPPTVGIGIGIDRLTMLLTNTPSIKEVILFPTLKKEHL